MIKQLFEEICRIKGGTFVISNAECACEMKLNQLPSTLFQGEILHISAPEWNFHINTAGIAEAHFVKQKEPSGTIPFLYFLSFKDKDQQTLLSFFFPNPYLNSNTEKSNYQKDREILFESIKNKYSSPPLIKYIENL